MIRAILSQPNSSTARWRPATPMAAALAGSDMTFVSASATAGLEADRVGLVVVHQVAGLALDDDLGDAADVAGHDGRLAGHRLEVHDAQRLVHRRAGEHARVGQGLDQVRPAQVLVDPDHVGLALARPQGGHAGLHLGAELGGVRGRGDEHQGDVRVHLGGGLEQVRDALLAGDPADEQHVRAARVDPDRLDQVGVRGRAGRARCRCRCGPRRPSPGPRSGRTPARRRASRG